jgi:hypothetical protein
MSIFNRRNAVLGWLLWAVYKRDVKRKARSAVPSIDLESGRPNKSAVALLVASSVGALTLVKKRSGGDESAT